MKVKFKKLSPEAITPRKGTKGSAGFDFTAISKEQIDQYHTKFGTGIAVEIPHSHVGLVFPRSSSYKNGMLLSNCVGVIDSDYRGEITAVFIGTDKKVCYNIGDRVFQLIIVPYPEIEFEEVEELSTNRKRDRWLRKYRTVKYER